MTCKITFQTVQLRVERGDGWLHRLLAASERLGYAVESFRLRGASGRELNVMLTLHSPEPRPDTGALLRALERLPGIRYCGGLPRAELATAPRSANAVGAVNLLAAAAMDRF